MRQEWRGCSQGVRGRGCLYGKRTHSARWIKSMRSGRKRRIVSRDLTIQMPVCDRPPAKRVCPRLLRWPGNHTLVDPLLPTQGFLPTAHPIKSSKADQRRSYKRLVTAASLPPRSSCPIPRPQALPLPCRCAPFLLHCTLRAGSTASNTMSATARPARVPSALAKKVAVA